MAAVSHLFAKSNHKDYALEVHFTAKEPKVLSEGTSLYAAFPGNSTP
jgi:hypothetical protein